MDTRCPDCHERTCLCTLDPDFNPNPNPLPDPSLAYRRLLDEEAFESRMQGISPADYRRGLEEMLP